LFLLPLFALSPVFASLFCISYSPLVVRHCFQLAASRDALLTFASRGSRLLLLAHGSVPALRAFNLAVSPYAAIATFPISSLCLSLFSLALCRWVLFSYVLCCYFIFSLLLPRPSPLCLPSYLLPFDSSTTAAVTCLVNLRSVASFLFCAPPCSHSAEFRLLSLCHCYDPYQESS
jgi:hypothetical protein